MDINKYIGSKMREFREQKNLTQDDIAELLGTTLQTISRYELGERKATHDVLFKLATYFNKSINDFFPPLNFDNATPTETAISDSMVTIPVLGVIKAGIPIEAQEDIIEYIEIPKKWTLGGKQFYGLQVSGDSMFPKYNDKDIVIFEKIEDMKLGNNKDCAVMVNGNDATFKKVILTAEGITLVPYNTGAYDIKMYSKKDIEDKPIRIIGMAVERRNKV